MSQPMSKQFVGLMDLHTTGCANLMAYMRMWSRIGEAPATATQVLEMAAEDGLALTDEQIATLVEAGDTRRKA